MPGRWKNVLMVDGPAELSSLQFAEIMLILEGIDRRLADIERRLDDARSRELDEAQRKSDELLARNRAERELFMERVERFGRQ